MKIKKKTFKKAIIILIILLILIISFFIYKNYKNSQDPYQFQIDTLNYAKYRGKTEYNLELKSSDGETEIYTLNYKTKPFLNYETTINGLLFMPTNKKNIPALIFLPAGGAKKEGRTSLASDLTKEGYAVLTIDQRGIGETGGYYLNFQEDYQILLNGDEPIQHLSVYDALKAFDVLRKIKNIDKNKITISGESMGGRYAIIAAAIDKRIKGVIAISSSGFHIQKNPFQPGNEFLLSIDPDHYINKISPNPIFMLHGANDSMISIEDAQITYNLANQPKEFFIAEGCTHGYCDKMYPEILKALKQIFQN